MCFKLIVSTSIELSHSPLKRKVSIKLQRPMKHISYQSNSNRRSITCKYKHKIIHLK